MEAATKDMRKTGSVPLFRNQDSLESELCTRIPELSWKNAFAVAFGHPFGQPPGREIHRTPTQADMFIGPLEIHALLQPFGDRFHLPFERQPARTL